MTAHGMSEAGGLRECVEALADEPWHWTEGRILHDRLRALLAARPAPEADPAAREREAKAFIAGWFAHARNPERLFVEEALRAYRAVATPGKGIKA